MSKEKLEFYKWPAIISIIFLLLSFASWPYGYYTFMKFIVAGSAVYYAYYLYQIKKQNFWFWGLVVIIILFNPIIPIHLGVKAMWGFIDVAVIGFLIGIIIKFRK